MLTRQMIARRPLNRLSDFSKSVIRFWFDEAWKKGECCFVLGKGEIQVEHLKRLLIDFKDGELSISYYVTKNENISVTLYR